jgi:hypothetical protein
VYERSTLSISLGALSLNLYAAIARPILFIVSGNSVPILIGVQKLHPGVTEQMRIHYHSVTFHRMTMKALH